ncbi:MAG TPA: glycosyltransferase family 2 protein [Anaeromyxobacteraceae bacterium]|nr:glycosyltransferase family 2 protein [Anaeromyxobacteraceae bacterium]
MRLGGYVIHGDNADTLPRCLDSLAAVSDALVAVDSCSRDGSADLSRARGFRTIVHPWEGYGAARAVAAEALAGCDYVFFLDSDEWLLPDAIEAIRAWKRSGPDAPHYALVRRDWADLPTGRFLFRTERHVRLVRADAARWERRMIVHEALPRARTVNLPIALEHRFATDVAAMRSKIDRYALLWALRFHREGRRPKPAWLQHVAHLGRGAVLKGAVLRGGLEAWRLADALARYHARKHELLREVRRGAYPDLVRALEEDRLGDLYRHLPR